MTVEQYFVMRQSSDEEVRVWVFPHRMPVKSFQVTRRSRVTWRDFTGMSDVEKPILALPNHWIDIPGK